MKPLLLAILLSVGATTAVLANPTATIFVKDAEEFQAIQKELDQLKSGLGQSNPEVDALWERANDIAKMNDRCAMISINEALDEECSHFYAVELPEFETRFMELTGELRLGFMSMGNSLAERTEQIRACASALGGIVVSKEQLLKLNGTVLLEPLTFDGAFDATYDFNLFYDYDRLDQQEKVVKQWLSKCGDIVLRQSGDEFAPLFLQSVEQINDSFKATGVNTKIVVTPKNLGFYLDVNKPVSGAYYLNGVRLFKMTPVPTGRKYSHLVVNVPKKSVMLPQGLDREVQKFEGRVEFTSEYQEKNLAGRWLWNSTKKKTNVKDAKVKGKITETAMKEVYADSSYEDKVFREAAAAAAAAANKKASDKNNSSPLPWILRGVGIATTITGVVLAVIGNNQAKDAADKGGKTVEELEKNRDDANSGQTLRNVGIGVAIVGTAGIGISFAF